MTTITSFIQQFVAAATGDDVMVQAQKAWRRANSAFKQELAAMEGSVLKLEDAVTDAKDALAKARINFTDSMESDQYINNIKTAQNNIIAAEKALKYHEAEREFLTQQWDMLRAEVPVKNDTKK